jgi:flagellar hook-length control protein FliK
MQAMTSIPMAAAVPAAGIPGPGARPQGIAGLTGNPDPGDATGLEWLMALGMAIAPIVDPNLVAAAPAQEAAPAGSAAKPQAAIQALIQSMEDGTAPVDPAIAPIPSEEFAPFVSPTSRFDRTFSVRELSHQLKSALASLEGYAESAPGDPAAQLRMAEGRLKNPAPEVAGGEQNAGRQGLDELLPWLRRPAGASDQIEILSLVDGAAPTDVSVEWEARPIADAQGNPRPATMVEQMRQVAEMLGERVDGVVRAGDRGVEANLKLYPPDLGGVRVTLNMTSGQNVQARFVVQHAQTAQLINENIGQLREGLARTGLNVERIQVTVAPVAAATGGTGGESLSNGNNESSRAGWQLAHERQQQHQQSARERAQQRAFEEFQG